MGRGPQRPALTGVGLGEPARSKGLSANLLSKSSSNGSNELARNNGLGARLRARSSKDGAKLRARSKAEGARDTLGARSQYVGGGT